jgi:hypothetical protein
VAVRYALGAPLRPLVVTNIFNDSVFVAHSKQNSNFKEDLQRSGSREHFVNFKRQHFGQHVNTELPFH